MSFYCDSGLCAELDRHGIYGKLGVLYALTKDDPFTRDDPILVIFLWDEEAFLTRDAAAGQTKSNLVSAIMAVAPSCTRSPSCPDEVFNFSAEDFSAVQDEICFNQHWARGDRPGAAYFNRAPVCRALIMIESTEEVPVLLDIGPFY